MASIDPKIDPKVSGNWNFLRSNDWSTKYQACDKNVSRTAPLNINTGPGDIVACNSLCRLSVNYQPTTCSVSMINNIPTVTFSPTCLIKFKNMFYYLSKMTMHYTSMHTINNGYLDLEILLYHNKNSINDRDGGIILSILLTKGGDYGVANEFMNEFINQMPSNEMPIEKDVDVSSDWNPEQLFPKSKSFYYYDGALPYPPCTPKWTFIIFEEVVPISMNIIDTVKYMIGSGNTNIRPIQKRPKGIDIFYNANANFDNIQDMSNAAINSATTPTIELEHVNSLTTTSWLKRNIYYIKGIFITIILIFMIFVAIKLSKIIVTNDLLNSFIIKQLNKRQERLYQESQQQMSNQQAAEYGGVAPVEAPNNNANNNNNNNNNN
jgi:carbonic anhydrase